MARQETGRGKELLDRLLELPKEDLASMVVELASRVAEQRAELQRIAEKCEYTGERSSQTDSPPCPIYPGCHPYFPPLVLSHERKHVDPNQPRG